jgi:hypothetical protein
MADSFDLILFEELLESVFVGLEWEVDLIHIVSRIDIDNVLILWNAAFASEFSSRLVDQLRHSE